jgi:alpha-N-arabinofuranosidase
MDMDAGQGAYRYRDGGETRTLASSVDIRFLSTQKAGGFVGVVVGPYVQTAAASGK